MPIQEPPYNTIGDAHEEGDKQPRGVVGRTEQLECPHHGRDWLSIGFILLLFLWSIIHEVQVNSVLLEEIS